MTKSYRVPAYFTLINWVLAVLFGSLLIPIVFSIFGERDNSFNNYYAEGFLMFGAISGLCSIPAIVVLLIFNILLNKRKISKSQFIVIQLLVHLVVSVLTFAVIARMEGGGMKDFILPVGVTYFGTGTIIWLIVMLLHKEKQVEELKQNDELIDSI